jgi:hypothetical protein
MANLDGYIDFNIVMTKTPTTSELVLSDPDNYPPGVDVGLKGYFVITQPDNITITGNYLSPDIEWNGSQLTQATKELRLTSVGGFQQGTYTITYNIEAPGYDETTLTKTFVLTYTSPTIVVTESFDVFTPVLTLTDDTDYEQDGMTINVQVPIWNAFIITVEGSTQAISSFATTFDLGYLGSYYDSQYDVTLLASVSYTLESPNNWVTIVDNISFEQTYYAFIPPSISDLLDLLTAYKATVDAAHCICGPGCVTNCTTLKSTYTLAVAIFTHIVERGREGLTEGLDAYVLQLQKLLSNCVTPTYTNTNEAIPPYDWGSSGGSSFTFFKQMIVGSGVNNAPADGATNYTDALLVGKSVQVFLDSLLMGFNLADRISISYVSGSGSITWNTPLVSNQLISIYSF